MVESEEEDYLKFICIFYKIADSSAVQFLPCFYFKKKKKKVTLCPPLSSTGIFVLLSILFMNFKPLSST